MARMSQSEDMDPEWFEELDAVDTDPTEYMWSTMMTHTIIVALT